MILFSQNTTDKLPILNPTQGKLIDKNKKGEEESLKYQEKCKALFNKEYNNLSEAEKVIYNECDANQAGYWDILEGGCSWYCGVEENKISASSNLKSNDKNLTYLPQNVHDLSYKTAWVEGVEGDGIGESLTYHFPAQNPRITSIIIINGYVKSEKSWKENSRVKQLKMYINDVPTALLNLKDTRNEQIFTVEPIGIADRTNLEKLKTKPWWSLKFEIVEVYKGEKYQDTAITEIYFDGIDVH